MSHNDRSLCSLLLKNQSEGLLVSRTCLELKLAQEELQYENYNSATLAI
jgi:hypothetical protein